jgi:hypothetical protein
MIPLALGLIGVTIGILYQDYWLMIAGVLGLWWLVRRAVVRQ